MNPCSKNILRAGMRLSGGMFCIVFILFKPGFATEISGLISTDQTWPAADNPFIIADNTLVGSGTVLTIEPGVIVKFNKGLTLQINGTLIARGTSDSTILFTANSTGDTAGYWRYIHLANATNAVFSDSLAYQAGTVLEHAVIEYGGGTGSTGALQTSSCHVFINNVTVRRSATSGIFLGAGGSVVRNSVFESNASHGIAVNGAEKTTLKDNASRENNGYGISFDASGLVMGNIVFKNKGHGISGYCKGGGFEITRNISMSNGGIGISLDGCIMSVTKNISISNASGGIRLMDDGSIASQNIIAGNSGLAYQGKESCNGNLINSLVYANSSTTHIVFLTSYAPTKSFSCNTVVSNTAPTTIFIAQGCCGGPNAIHQCNIRNNIQHFELSSNFGNATTIRADANWWGTVVDTTIQSRIYDWFDNVDAAVVQYQPVLTEMDTVAPISPPDSVVKSLVEFQKAIMKM